MARENSKEILDAFAIGPFDHQMNVITTNRAFVDFHVKEVRSLAQGGADEFGVAQEAPPAHGVMRFESNMVGALRVQRPQTSAFANSQRSTVFSR